MNKYVVIGDDGVALFYDTFEEAHDAATECAVDDGTAFYIYELVGGVDVEVVTKNIKVK